VAVQTVITFVARPYIGREIDPVFLIVTGKIFIQTRMI
jgi:hypothetical protein